MKKSETLQIIQRLACMYPSFKFGDLPEGLSIGGANPIEFWHEQIGDMDFDKAVQATKISIDRCKFVPSAADIREAYNELANEEKKLRDTCNYNYKLCRGIYPKELEEGYGYKEFVDKVMTAKPEKRIEAAQYIYSHMNKVVYSGEEVPDFVEIIKGIK